MWGAFLNSILVALAVVALAVPIGTSAAILLNLGKFRATFYGFMVAPVLAPGLVIGISTVLFWNQLGHISGAEDFALPGVACTCRRWVRSATSRLM